MKTKTAPLTAAAKALKARFEVDRLKFDQNSWTVEEAAKLFETSEWSAYRWLRQQIKLGTMEKCRKLVDGKCATSYREVRHGPK